MSVATTGIGEGFGFGYLFPDWFDLAQPAAGANKGFTVPGDYSMRVTAARATLTTDANAANRFLSLDFIDGRGITRVRNAAGLVVTASTTNQAFEWTRNRGVAEWAANTPVLVPVLDAILYPGFVVQFTIDSKQAGDQLTGLSLFVEKFPTGPRGYPEGMTPE